MRLALLALCLALPAQAAVLGVVTDPNGRLDLHDERGVCVGPARRAEFVPVDGPAVPGCWIPNQRGVFVLFFDGDVAQIPAQAIKRPTAS